VNAGILGKETVGKLKSLGKVESESGSPILPRTREGNPLPSFQKQVMDLTLSFKILPPVLTRSLDIVLETNDVQKAYHSLKEKARDTKDLKVTRQLIDNESPNAKQALVEYEFNEKDFNEFMSFLTIDKEPRGYVSSKRIWDLSEEPEKMKKIPAFQKQRAKVTVSIRKLTPVVMERRGILIKLKSEDLSRQYSALRNIAKQVEGAKLSASRFSPKENDIRFTVTVDEENIHLLIKDLEDANKSGKFLELEKWVFEENSDTSISKHANKVAVVALRFEAFRPFIIKTAELTLFSSEPGKVLEKAKAYASQHGKLENFKLRSDDNHKRWGNVYVQMELKDYDNFITEFKKLVPAGDLLRNKDQANNPDEFIFYASGILPAGMSSPWLYVLQGPTLPLTPVDRTPPLVGAPARTVSYADRSILQPETVYLTTDRRRPSQAWLSEDAGDNWANVTLTLANELPDADYRELIANPSNLNQLFLATGVGVLRSDDGGTSWYRYMNGLAMVADIRSIELSFDNAVEPELVIGTNGRGWWRRVIDESPIEAQIFVDGFESGNTSAWSETTP
jgi:hypothetical protein